LIQSQPRSGDEELRALLGACETPCLLGLRPGFTRIDTAIRGLDRHPWVADLHSQITALGGYAELSWDWHEDTPDIIDTRYPGRVRVSEGVVFSVSIETRIPVGTWHLSLGHSLDKVFPGAGGAMRYLSMFSSGQSQWQISALVDCPAAVRKYWLSFARLEVVRPTLDSEPESIFLLPANMRSLCIRS
jgi:hypothetical protein